MRQKRRTKRYYGYGVITDTIKELIRSRDWLKIPSKVMTKGMQYLGNKLGNKVANKLFPSQNQIQASSPDKIEEAMEILDSDSLNRVPTKKEVFNAINLMETEDDYN